MYLFDESLRRHIFAIIYVVVRPIWARVGRKSHPLRPDIRGFDMRKIALFAAAAGAALTLAACSEKTEDAAATAADSAVADTEANMEAAGEEVTETAAEVEAGAEAAAAEADAETAEVEADAQDETVTEAKAD